MNELRKLIKLNPSNFYFFSGQKRPEDLKLEIWESKMGTDFICPSCIDFFWSFEGFNL
jgi:hypothetical protein